jgi:DNA-binding NtrC family response regulator
MRPTKILVVDDEPDFEPPLRRPALAIVVSAYGNMANIRAAMNRGAIDFVTKAVDLSNLDITVRRTPGDIARGREMPSLLGPHLTPRTVAL